MTEMDHTQTDIASKSSCQNFGRSRGRGVPCKQWRREGFCRPVQRSVVPPLQPAI